MKKIVKVMCLILACAMCAAVFFACGDTVTTKTVYELSHYDGKMYEDGADAPIYGSDLWRRNDVSVKLADPQIFDDTDRSGYYYMYATGGANTFNAYRSTDASVWLSAGEILTLPSGWTATWAPEVVFDTLDETYYMFYSATFPNALNSDAYANSYVRSLYVATSKTPNGPFSVVDFTDESIVGENNVREIDYDDYGYTCEYLANVLFEPIATTKKYAEIMPDRYSADETYLINNIDPSPYIDPISGKKYLYFNAEWQPSAIIGLEMENWLTPKIETLTVLARNGYYTIEDYEKSLLGESPDQFLFEQVRNRVNEAPFLYYHNSKYYLTYSCNGYLDATYSVVQAVGNTPMGPFRKLTEAENGIILSADNGGNFNSSGTGHHSFFHIGEKMYIAYHKHIVAGVGSNERFVAFDEVKWVTITDNNGESLDVMYVNGPTTTVQPTIAVGAEYFDISEHATVKLISVSLNSGSSINSINDGLLSYNTLLNQKFLDVYVKETEITSTSTFEFNFDTARPVRGLMVYNSKHRDKIFTTLTNIEFETEENGTTKTYYISKLTLDENVSVRYNDFELINGNYVVEMVTYGSSIYAEFAEIIVKSIRFTVEIPDGQAVSGISEVAIMGK